MSDNTMPRYNNIAKEGGRRMVNKYSVEEGHRAYLPRTGKGKIKCNEGFVAAVFEPNSGLPNKVAARVWAHSTREGFAWQSYTPLGPTYASGGAATKEEAIKEAMDSAREAEVKSAKRVERYLKKRAEEYKKKREISKEPDKGEE